MAWGLCYEPGPVGMSVLEVLVMLTLMAIASAVASVAVRPGTSPESGDGQRTGCRRHAVELAQEITAVVDSGSRIRCLPDGGVIEPEPPAEVAR